MSLAEIVLEQAGRSIGRALLEEAEFDVTVPVWPVASIPSESRSHRGRRGASTGA